MICRTERDSLDLFLRFVQVEARQKIVVYDSTYFTIDSVDNINIALHTYLPAF